MFKRIFFCYIIYYHWLKDCKELAPKSVLLVLIGNKTDLEDQRVISKERGENLARENNMMLREIIDRLHNPNEDIKNFVINVIANAMTNRR